MRYVILKTYQVVNSETKRKKQNQPCQYINWLISISVSLCTGYWMLSLSLCTESTLSVYKLTDINFSQFMYWLLNDICQFMYQPNWYPPVYVLADIINWLWHIHTSICTRLKFPGGPGPWKFFKVLDFPAWKRPKVL